MFLDIKILTKLMKEAYKSTGLIMGCVNKGLLISTPYWKVWLDNEHIPNTIKAAVVQYCGFVPKDDNRLFDISKERPDIQYTIPLQEEILSVVEGHNDARFKLLITPILLEEGCDVRVLQSAADNQIYGIDQKYLSMIDPGAVDYNIESTPTGPCYINTSGEGKFEIYWHNDFCNAVILSVPIRSEKIAAALTQVNFNSEDNSHEQV